MSSADASAARTIAIASGKGGVGKTNLSVNLGLALCRAGNRVALLDADLGLANIDVLLGLKPTRTLADVLDGRCRIEDALLDGPGGISILPASSGVRRMAQLADTEHVGLIRACAPITHWNDYLVVDTGAGISDSVALFCQAVRETVVVICDEPASITDAYALVKVLRQDFGIVTFTVVANMVKDDAHGQRIYEAFARVVDRFLDVRLRFLGAIPSDRYLQEAVRARRAVVEMMPMSKSARAFQALARRLGNRSAPPGTANSALQFDTYSPPIPVPREA